MLAQTWAQVRRLTVNSCQMVYVSIPAMANIMLWQFYRVTTVGAQMIFLKIPPICLIVKRAVPVPLLKIVLEMATMGIMFLATLARP